MLKMNGMILKRYLVLNIAQNIRKEKHDSKIDASGINAIADNRKYRKHFMICPKQIFAHDEKNIERRIITM